MSKITKVIIGIIVFVVAVWGYKNYANKKANVSMETVKESIKIGAAIPLTGAKSVYGQAVKEGTELAIDDLGSEKQKINFLYEDNEGDTAKSVSAARKFIDIDKVKVIMTSLSPESLAIAPIAEQNKVILFSTVSQASALTNAGDYIFRDVPLLNFQGTALAQLAFKKGYKKAATIVNGSNDGLVDAQKAFVQEFVGKGGNVVAQESYLGTATDMRTELSKIISSKPEIIVLFGLVKDTALVLKQKGDLKISMPFYSGSGIEDPQVIEAAGKAAENILFSTFTVTPPQTFIDKYKNKFGHDPLRYSLESYDAVMLLKLAADKCVEATTTCIKDNLYKITNYNGLSGNISFDKNGDVIKPILFKIIKDGKFVLLEN